jgi:hypothetical protein
MSNEVYICKAVLGPDSEDPFTYVCNRETPHRNHHSLTAPDGELLASWCSCEECAIANLEDEPL